MAGNGNSGGKPKPTALKKLQGNPGGRPLNKDEPEGKQYEKMPDPPEFLGPYAVKEWWRAGPILIRMRLLTDSDLASFATYCENWELMILASLDIRENGMTVTNQRGKVRNPSLATFASASTTMRALAAEFGMTPSSRSRMKFSNDDDDEDLADIFAPLEQTDSDVE